MKKKAFQILIGFADDKPMTIGVNASFSPKTYNAALKGVPLNELSCFSSGNGMAEGVFNDEKDMAIADAAFNYWFYDEPDFHRFDATDISEGRLIVVRTVSKLRDTKTKDYIDPKTLKKPLYLVFSTWYYPNSNSEAVELQRECLKIEWENTQIDDAGKKSKKTFLNPDADGWDTKTINYRSIRQNITNPASNFYYPKLWERFQQGDSTLTLEESRHLYYGYVFHKNYSQTTLNSTETG